MMDRKIPAIPRPIRFPKYFPVFGFLRLRIFADMVKIESLRVTNQTTKTGNQIMLTTARQVANLETFVDGDNCPVHGTPHKKLYTFGSTMTAETDVCVFHGCRCAVAIKHDPVGVLASVATVYDSYNEAAGVGKLRAIDAAAKYR